MNMQGPPRGPRPDWNRPPMHPGQYNQGNKDILMMSS